MVNCFMIFQRFPSIDRGPRPRRNRVTVLSRNLPQLFWNQPATHTCKINGGFALFSVFCSSLFGRPFSPVSSLESVLTLNALVTPLDSVLTKNTQGCVSQLAQALLPVLCRRHSQARHDPRRTTLSPLDLARFGVSVPLWPILPLILSAQMSQCALWLCGKSFLPSAKIRPTPL